MAADPKNIVASAPRYEFKTVANYTPPPAVSTTRGLGETKDRENGAPAAKSHDPGA